MDSVVLWEVVGTQNQLPQKLVDILGRNFSQQLSYFPSFQLSSSTASYLIPGIATLPWAALRKYCGDYS